MENSKYWQERAERGILDAEKSSEELLKITKKNYEKALHEIDNEINRFYARFTRQRGITYEETLQRLNKKELKLFHEQAKLYYDEAIANDWQTAYSDHMRTLSGKAYMSRLEELKVNIYHQYQKVFEELNIDLEEGLSKQYDERFYNAMYDTVIGTGVGCTFSAPSSEMIQRAVREKWSGDNYSGRVWKNKERLISTLNQVIPQAFTLGKHPYELAKDIKAKTGASYKNAERLARTEYNRIANEASTKAYEEYGLEKYEFCATLDNRTSELCGELDGKIFDYKEKSLGVNFPPMHPNCRSTTLPYFDDEPIGERLAKDKNGKYYKVPGNMTYKEWLDSLQTKGKDGKIISGGISGARNPYGKAAEKHARKYYGLVRSMKTDVEKIATVTGYTKDEIQGVKDYIFNNKHDLGNGKLEYFEPDYMMAESWRRLIDGNPEEHDMILIEHELMERRLMGQGYNQEDAHIITSKKFNYDKEANAFYGKVKKYKKE